MSLEVKRQQQPAWLSHLTAAEAALRDGDPASARRHLEAGQAVDTQGTLRMRMFQADLLLAENRTAAAKDALDAAGRAFPCHFWPWLKLALMAKEKGDIDSARDLLGQAIARDPEEQQPKLRLVQADLFLEEGREVEATDVLRPLCRGHPELPGLSQRLIVLARQPLGYNAAKALFECLMKTTGGALQMRLHHVQMLIEAGETEAAVGRLQDLQQQHPRNADILGRLARARNAANQTDKEYEALQGLIAVDPLDPVLLRHLFASVPAAGTVQLDQICASLRPRLAASLADELEIQALIRTRRLTAACARQRRLDLARRTPMSAANLAITLVGQFRQITALRYLRFCLRRWPDNVMLLAHFMRIALQSGRYGDIERQLQAIEGRVPDHVVLGHVLVLKAYRGDLEAAVPLYARLQILGRVRPAHRVAINVLIFTSLDPAAANQVFERIGHPLDGVTDPHFRAGLFGQQIMEFDLECAALAGSESFATLEDWARARPGATVPAVRLVTEWRGADRPKPRAGPADGAGADIPRQIYQYWNQTEPPPDIHEMMESWRGAEGFTYRLMDRAAATRFLRESMGPRWFAAFKMTRNAAQEADLVRLCALARFGGVYADADDVLTSDLSALLAQSRGLLAYTEPLGGIVANNFLAAPPGHPVIVHAARLARAALLQRSNETVWSSTGPGLLTRALAHYVLHAGPEEARKQVTLLEWSEVAGRIQMHNPAQHKTSAGHWNGPGPQRHPSADLWDRLQSTLDARAEAC